MNALIRYLIDLACGTPPKPIPDPALIAALEAEARVEFGPQKVEDAPRP